MSRTSMVILASLCVLGIYDLYVVASGDFEDPISKFWQNSSFSSPMVSFIVGAICGHFFFYMRHSKLTKELKQTLIEEGWASPERTKVSICLPCENMRPCQVCKSKLNDVQKFCLNCGEILYEDR